MTDSAERHTPAISTSKPLAASPNSSLRNHQNPHHWKIRNRTFPASEIRLRKDSSRSRKRTVPATPRFGWKFDEANLSVRKLPAPRERKPGRKRRSRDGVRVSARKLAAALWHLQLPEASRSFRRQRKGLPEIPAVGHVRVQHNGNPNKADFDLGPHAQFWSSFSIPSLSPSNLERRRKKKVEMGVFTFVCRSSGEKWNGKQLSGDLEASASSTFELQRSLVKAALSTDSSGGVQSSFSMITPSSAVFQVIIGGGGGGGAFIGGGAATATSSAGGAAAAEAPPAEEKKEEKEESDEDMGFSLFD